MNPDGRGLRQRSVSWNSRASVARRFFLSKHIWRGSAYLSRYVRSGVPWELGKQERLALAEYFGVREDDFQDSARLAVAPLDDEQLQDDLAEQRWSMDAASVTWEEASYEWREACRQIAQRALTFLRPLARDGRFR